MFTLSRADLARDLLLRWRVVTAAGAATMAALGFMLGVLAAPALG